MAALLECEMFISLLRRRVARHVRMEVGFDENRLQQIITEALERLTGMQHNYMAGRTMDMLSPSEVRYWQDRTIEVLQIRDSAYSGMQGPQQE